MISSMRRATAGSFGVVRLGKTESGGVRRPALALVPNVLFPPLPLQPPTIARGPSPAQHPLPPAGPYPRGAEARVLRGTRTPGHPRGLPFGQ